MFSSTATNCKVWALFCLLLFVTQCDGESPLSKDLTITRSQKLLLDKFKELVSSRLPHDYMREDIYLIRWLRASNFDLKGAEAKLIENLQWRKENKMDTVIYENWTNFENEYPYFLEGCDNEGRPASANTGDWDIRKAVLSGQIAQLERYSNKLYEEITVLIRIGQAEGKNVTQFSIILNMNNFNLIQTGCPLCIPYFISILTSYERHYPGSVHRLLLVNTPILFETVLNNLLPFVPPSTRNRLTVYGRDKRSWQSKLLSYMPKDQLTTAFGGTKERALEPDEVRKINKFPC